MTTGYQTIFIVLIIAQTAVYCRFNGLPPQFMNPTKDLFRQPLFYIAIVVGVNLLQSIFTELANDEAYFWVFSQNMEWGFFDHPPASPLLMAMGYALLENELGVRLFILLANTLAVWCIWKIVAPKNTLLFFALFFSCAMAHLGFFRRAR